ncbi:MAG: MSHA operon transcriptional regulator [Vibrio sp.]
MTLDKFTNIYRLPGSIQIRIAKWQRTFKGTSDIVLYEAIRVRNQEYRKRHFLPKGWSFSMFKEEDISITHHGRYIQTTMLTMIDRKVAYKRIYLSRIPEERAYSTLQAFKIEWLHKYNQIVEKYNKLKKKEFLQYAHEELDTLYPSITKGKFDCDLWNKLVHSKFGPPQKFSNPFYVDHVAI